MRDLEKHKNKITFFLGILIIILFIIAYMFSDAFREIFKISMISFVIAYILRPIKKYIKSIITIKESYAALMVIMLVFCTCIVSLVLIVPVALKELKNIEPTINNFINFLEESIKDKESSIYSYVNVFTEWVKTKINMHIYDLEKPKFDKLMNIGKNAIGFAIIPVVIYYLLSDGKFISRKVYNCIPIDKRYLFRAIVSDIDKLLERYLVSQIILSIIISVFTFLLLFILKIKFSIALALLNGIVNIIPYFGPIFGAVPIILIALLDSPIKGMWVAIGIFILQQVEGNILSPKITGSSIDMHPLYIIVLLIIGEAFAGFLGMLIAIPIGVIIKVIYEDINYYIF